MPPILLIRKRKKGIETLNSKVVFSYCCIKLLLNWRKREKLTRGLEAESVGLETIDDVTCGVRSRSKEEESKRESLTLVCGYMTYGGNKRNVIFGGCVSYAPFTTATIFFIIFYAPSNRVSWDTNFSILRNKIISKQRSNVLSNYIIYYWKLFFIRNE